MAFDDRQAPDPMYDRVSERMPDARVLRALRGAQWLVNAYVIFRGNAGAWMLVLLGLLAAMVVSSILQVIGPLVFGLLFPVFSVGVALAAQAADRGEPIVPAHFMSGFRSSTSDLVAIGGIYLVGQLMIVGVIMAIGGAGVAQGMAAAGGVPGAAGATGATAGPAAVTGAMAFAGLVGLALLVPLLLASWFAPLLVYFHGQKALPSLLASLGAAARNWRAFLVCFLGLFLVMLLARLVVTVLMMLPAIGPLLAMAFLGALLAVLAPVGLIAFYTSYVDVFAPIDDSAGQDSASQDPADDVADESGSPQRLDAAQGRDEPPASPGAG
jgi:hypothetical protein